MLFVSAKRLCTHSGLGQLRVAVEVRDAEQREVGPDIDEVLESCDLYILGDDAEGDDLVAPLDTCPGDEVARKERNHAEGVRGSAVCAQLASPFTLLISYDSVRLTKFPAH